MDHAQQPGSGDRLAPVALLSLEGTSLEECSWRACKGRRPQCRLSEDVRWRSFRLAKALPATDRQLSWRSRFESQTRPPDYGHRPVPIAVCPCAHQLTAH